MKILIEKDTKKAFQEFAGILKFLKIWRNMVCLHWNLVQQFIQLRPGFHRI